MCISNQAQPSSRCPSSCFPYRADDATFRPLIPSTEAAWGAGRSQGRGAKFRSWVGHCLWPGALASLNCGVHVWEKGTDNADLAELSE